MFTEKGRGGKVLDLNKRLNQIKIRDIIIIYLFSTFIVSGIIFGIVKINQKEVENFILNTLTLILQLVVLIILVLKIKLSKQDIMFLYEDFKKKIDKRELFNVTFIKICIALGGGKLIISFLYFIDPSIVNNFIYESSSLINTFRNYLLNVVLLVMIAPIVDEIVFRGVIFNRIIQKFNLCVGIIVSSIIYASFYAGSGIAGAFALGIINCILYIKYRNILINIFVNFINNVIVLISVLPVVNKNVNYMIITYCNVIINIFLGSIFCIGLIYLLIKFINKNSNVLISYDKYVKAHKELNIKT